MSDKNRRKILTLLKDGDLSVNEILKSFSITQATLSNHLSILKKANLVSCVIKGKQRIYKINVRLFDAFLEELNKFGDNLKKHDVVQEISVRK